MNITIQTNSTSTPCVSDREISYDLYVNGAYHSTYSDILDAQDARELLENQL
jgi:hypothetical protein